MWVLVAFVIVGLLFGLGLSLLGWRMAEVESRARGNALTASRQELARYEANDKTLRFQLTAADSKSMEIVRENQRLRAELERLREPTMPDHPIACPACGSDWHLPISPIVRSGDGRTKGVGHRFTCGNCGQGFDAVDGAAVKRQVSEKPAARSSGEGGASLDAIADAAKRAAANARREPPETGRRPVMRRPPMEPEVDG